MSVADLIKKHDFNESLLIGYYGGGNFGDELLLEVLLNMFKKNGVSKLDIVSRLRKSTEGRKNSIPLNGYRLILMRARMRSLLGLAASSS